MTVAELVALFKVRLGLAGGVTSDERVTGSEYVFLTHARDMVRDRLALAAPLAITEVVTLEQDPTVKSRWAFPDDTADALYVSRPREITTGQVLSPANKLDFDGGTYKWQTLRALRVLTGHVPAGGLELDAVLQQQPIEEDGEIGLPPPCHAAVALAGAQLVLTVNEDSPGKTAAALFEAEMNRLERLYSQYDEARGMELREAFLESAGRHYGDTLY